VPERRAQLTHCLVEGLDLRKATQHLDIEIRHVAAALAGLVAMLGEPLHRERLVRPEPDLVESQATIDLELVDSAA
jgi:hypothetical protein